MSYIVIVILFFLGLITLWVFLFGILLWILAVVYAIKSDAHRIFMWQRMVNMQFTLKAIRG